MSNSVLVAESRRRLFPSFSSLRTDSLLALPRHTVSERRVSNSFRHQQGLTNRLVLAPVACCPCFAQPRPLRPQKLLPTLFAPPKHKVKMARTKSCESPHVPLPSTPYERASALIAFDISSPSSFHYEKGVGSPRTVRSSSSNGSDLSKLTSDAVVPRPQDPAVRALARLSDGTCNLSTLGVPMARAWLRLRAYEAV